MQNELFYTPENKGFYNISSGNELELYRKRVESYIKENQDNLTIQRIKRNQPITKMDLEELDNKLFEASGISEIETYKTTIHPDKSLGVFIRELVGLDSGAAKETFANHLDDAKFNINKYVL